MSAFFYSPWAHKKTISLETIKFFLKSLKNKMKEEKKKSWIKRVEKKKRINSKSKEMATLYLSCFVVMYLENGYWMIS